MRRLLILLIGLLFAGCVTPKYCREIYCERESPCQAVESDFFLVFCVEARHLDYHSSSRSLIKSVSKHPADGSKNGDVGHAWIYMQGIVDGEQVVVEGGHSGERGRGQPRYFEGIANYLRYGYADPSEEEQLTPRHEPNPIRYLWASQEDGFFQPGSGGHVPTFAARVELTEEQFLKVLAFIDPSNYDYRDYNITGNQCSSFVAKIGAIVDFPIDCELTFPIDREVVIQGDRVVLWEDPAYATITISSPDVIEKSLTDSVQEGRATYALPWARERYRRTFSQRLESVKRFPSRYLRHILL
jgi:hypothetical protein